MNRIILSTTLTLAAASPFAVPAQDLPQNLNRFSFGPTFAFNLKASFGNHNNPGPAAGGADRTYDDGYVRVDSSGPLSGSTWNWGYQNAAQVADSTMQFHSIQDVSSTTDNPQYGGELIYQRVIGTLPFLSGEWGLEGGFGFTEIDLRENVGATGSVITDSYQRNGEAPSAGYNGSFAGPGNLLGSTPVRGPASATLTGYQKLSGQMFSFRLGPFAEWNLTPKLSLAASAGLTLAPTTIDFDFSETAVLAGGGVISANGHSSKTSLLCGPYVGAMLRYDFTKSWGLYVGARFQNLNDLEQSAGTRTARLDPGAMVYGTMGLTWHF